MHRAGQRCFELLAIIGSPQLLLQESTTKEVKLFDYDFRGHTRGTLVVGMAYGYPYYRGSAIFSLVFFSLSTTSEKSFIP